MSSFSDRHNTPSNREGNRKRLIAELRTASAWGTPDRESTGYSHAEFASLCGEAAQQMDDMLLEIETLRTQLRAR